MADWKKIKAEYIKGGISYPKLAKKHGVPLGTLKRKAANEKWTAMRSRSDAKASLIMENSIASENAKKALKINLVADKLLDKIINALDGSDVIGSQELKHYTSALKDIKDIKGIKSDMDLKEQEARIDKLRKEAEAEQTETEIEVTMGAEVDAYAN